MTSWSRSPWPRRSSSGAWAAITGRLGAVSGSLVRPLAAERPDHERAAHRPEAVRPDARRDRRRAVHLERSGRPVRRHLPPTAGRSSRCALPDAAGKLAGRDAGLRRPRRLPGAQGPYFGCLVGRYGNRIGRARASRSRARNTRWRGTTARTTCTAGVRGFDKVVWAAHPLTTPAGPALELSYRSRDGEEGYPGRPRRHGHVHAGRRRAADRLRRHHRPAHPLQPDQPRLLQPGRRGEREHPRPPAAASRAAALHGGRPGPHPHRRAPAGRGDALRLPRADRASASGSTPTTRSSSSAAATTTTGSWIRTARRAGAVRAGRSPRARAGSSRS